MRTLFWFREDLRLRDNRGLAVAAAGSESLLPVYVLDDRLLSGGAPRARFLLDGLARLSRDLERRGSRLLVRRGQAPAELARLVRDSRADRVVWNRSYGPYAARRDAEVARAVEKAGARVETCKDRVVFESSEIHSQSGRPYAVYSPYRKAWHARWAEQPERTGPPLRLPSAPRRPRSETLPAPESGGPELPTAGEAAARRRLDRFLEASVGDYAARRDVPAEDATSRLSPYLRFGMISIRECVEAGLERACEPRLAKGARKWVDELVWREFYTAILAENPRVATESYRREFDALEWNEDPEGFERWCAGRTGYPIVDAGMRQLAATGWMHNRVRMIVASFLTKDLLIDWRRGERFFYARLVDGDPASNNGGWQWSAGTGTDAQPFFRIFNPTTQGERFDPDGAYVKRWVPELAGLPDDRVHRPWESPLLAPGYPEPWVDHAERRREALERLEAIRRSAG